ncbi:MAG: hypothetical protein ACREU6_16725 [Steroidobacteraceae bacterium]
MGSFLLIYRGAFCPFCNAWLASFSNATDKLARLDVKIVAL